MGGFVLQEKNNAEECRGEIQRMTFEEYDRMLEEFQQVKVKADLPGPEEMDIIQSDIARFMTYACYLDEYGEKPRTKDEEYRKRTLRMFICEHLELVD